MFHCEQLFILSLPKQSKFPYKLISFATDIRTYNENTQYCATLLLFDKDKLANNDNDIIWQSPIFTRKDTKYLKPSDRDSENYIHPDYNQHIVLFDNINIPLRNDQVFGGLCKSCDSFIPQMEMMK